MDTVTVAAYKRALTRNLGVGASSKPIKKRSTKRKSNGKKKKRRSRKAAIAAAIKRDLVVVTSGPKTSPSKPYTERPLIR